MKWYTGISILLYYLSQVIYYNPSRSETIGYYFTYKPVLLNAQYKKNDLVLLCLNDSINKSKTDITHIHVLHQLGMPYIKNGEYNICGNRSSYLLKQIVAVAGDEVSITSHGVYINGKMYPNSKVQQYARYNGLYIDLLPMSYGKFHLVHDEYFVLGKTLHSYDSRYFGIVKKQQIYRIAKLLK